jgi:hypothetical protein
MPFCRVSRPWANLARSVKLAKVGVSSNGAITPELFARIESGFRVDQRLKVSTGNVGEGPNSASF